ncbi:MAG: hypothetical protein N2440_05170 [Actinobacteria bacterium]|nr:hypothetical protein [Actinomycetota bacterium]
MNLKTFRTLLIAPLIVLIFLAYGCNPSQVGSSSKAGNPEELKLAGTDNKGIPKLVSVGKPVVIMFTGNY